MATGPKIPTTPLELLANDGTREGPFLNKFWNPGVCGLLGFTSVVLANWATRKPVMSGIQKHILVTTAAVVIGKYIDDYRNDYLAERDAVFRHYIELHPEDFPDFSRQKYADLLEPWVPIR